jgi:outer membrane protein TolC
MEAAMVHGGSRVIARRSCAAACLIAVGAITHMGCASFVDAPPVSISSGAPTATVAVHTPNGQTAGAQPAKDGATQSTEQPAPPEEILPIDLATVLRLTDQQSPTINLARERVNEAFAALQRAEVLWLPTLQADPAYERHDGPWQRSTGDVIQVSKSYLFMGGGAEARFDLADAYFAPLIARRLTQAEMENSRAVTNNVQLEGASTYLDLMQVYAALAINADILSRVEEMVRRTDEADKAGVGKSKADPNRARTELNLRREERITLEAQAAAISARLAQLLYLQPTVDLQPADTAVVPIALVPTELPLGEMVATAYLNRPELASNRALVEAAVERWRQARYSPLIPKIDLAYYVGDFGGGRNSFMSNFDSRGDGLAQAV